MRERERESKIPRLPSSNFRLADLSSPKRDWNLDIRTKPSSQSGFILVQFEEIRERHASFSLTSAEMMTLSLLSPPSLSSTSFQLPGFLLHWLWIAVANPLFYSIIEAFSVNSFDGRINIIDLYWSEEIISRCSF